MARSNGTLNAAIEYEELLSFGSGASICDYSTSRNREQPEDAQLVGWLDGWQAVVENEEGQRVRR